MPPTSLSKFVSQIEGRALTQGSGEMAHLIRAHLWENTALGPIESWSETLIANVNLMRLLPFFFAIYWGEGLLLLYNDVYR